MQKNFLTLAVLVLTTVIFISGCGKKTSNQSADINNPVTSQNQEQNVSQNQNQVNTQVNETINPSGQYSINELFAMNKPMKCSWKDSVAKGDVTNIIYLNSKKFYQDVTMGEIGHSFSLYDGEFLYIWNDFNDASSKMKDTSATTGTEQKKDSVGLDQKKDFVCENWIADNSFFTPPQDRNFEDVTGEMNQAVKEMGDGGLEKTKQQACALCKSAPSQELRENCMGDMKCD